MPPKTIKNVTHMAASQLNDPGLDRALGSVAHVGFGYVTGGMKGAIKAGVSLADGSKNPAPAGQIVRKIFDNGQTITEYSDGVTMIMCTSYDGDPDITYWRNGQMIDNPY